MDNTEELIEKIAEDSSYDNDEDELCWSSSSLGSNNGARRRRGKTRNKQRVKIVYLSDQEKALMDAVKQGKVRHVHKLLEEDGVDVNFRDSFQRTPLMRACHLDKEDIRSHLVRLLLSHGADVNTTDNHGRTALMMACMEDGKDDVIRLLIRSGKLDPNIQDDRGNTAVVHAVKHANHSAIRVMVNSAQLKGFVDLERRNNDGNTPLMLAAKLLHKECCNVLVEEGYALYDNIPAHLKKMLPIAARLTSLNFEDDSRSMKRSDQNMKYGGLARGTRVDLAMLRLRQFSQDSRRQLQQGNEIAKNVNMIDIPADDGAVYRVATLSPISDEDSLCMVFQKRSHFGPKMLRNYEVVEPESSATVKRTAFSTTKNVDDRRKHYQRSFSESGIIHGDRSANLEMRPATSTQMEPTETIDKIIEEMNEVKSLSNSTSGIESPISPRNQLPKIVSPPESGNGSKNGIMGQISTAKTTQVAVTRNKNGAESKTSSGLSLGAVGENNFFSSSIAEKEDDIAPMLTFQNTNRLLRKHSEENLTFKIGVSPSTSPKPPSSPVMSDAESTSRKTSTEFLTEVFECRDRDSLSPNKQSKSASKKRKLSASGIKRRPRRTSSRASLRSLTESPTGSPAHKSKPKNERKRSSKTDKHHGSAGHNTSTSTPKVSVDSEYATPTNGSSNVTDIKKDAISSASSTRSEKRKQNSIDAEKHTPRRSVEKKNRGKAHGTVVYKTKSGRVIHPNAEKDPQYKKIVSLRQTTASAEIGNGSVTTLPDLQLAKAAQPSSS
uniref:Protein phosphatase 1 regulatory subunit 12A-like n=1 Tax=Saccoglossus kowalevskii TaxID=10224 RepID=A0ABM0M936_SACKO|nr:PREDICTED: protein phosphatase 1 regulatory subunit 12A-like [Saccoglossus kowalevskii]